MDIHIELDETYDIAATLRDIARQIEDGFTSGYYPTWNLNQVIES